MSATPQAAQRRGLVRRAMGLEALIISYNIFEGVVSIIAGILAGSIALVGFGMDSAIEVSAAVVVLVHLARSGEEVQEEWEGKVAVFVGATLLAVAAYVLVRAIFSLATEARPEESYLGIAITALSLLVKLMRGGHAESVRLGSEMVLRASTAAPHLPPSSQPDPTRPAP